MKKALMTISTAIVFAVCCLLSVTAYASETTDISSASVSLSQSSYTYNGSQHKPSVTVKIAVPATETEAAGEKTLTLGTDYTVAYSNNINHGTATVTVTGTGAYSGYVSKNFKVNAASISSPKVTVVSDAVAGKAPKLKLTFNGATLKEGTDYTISASNYKKAGYKTCKVVINGKSNFTGSKTLALNVKPAKVSGFDTGERTNTSVVVKWASQKNTGATHYRLYMCDSKGGNSKYLAEVKSTYCRVTGLKNNSVCCFRVMPVYKAGKKTVCGDLSAIYTTATRPNAVTNNKTTKTKNSKKLVVGWNKISCSGYTIQYSTDKNFRKGVKTTNVAYNKTSASISIPKTSKTYYARIKAYKKYKSGDKTITIYGNWSKTLSTSYSNCYEYYTTSYVKNANRTKNLQLACKAINGTVLKPGETFSFNKVVGKRTAAKGYKPATIFTGGSGTAQSLGGGVCQVASTMFNAALYSNFKIVERSQHSQRVSYCPLGRDAAIYWGSKDFKFKNTSGYPVKIKMTCSNGKLTCAFYTSYNVSPPKVTLKVSRSGKKFTLRRYVNGKVNYTTKSKY